MLDLLQRAEEIVRRDPMLDTPAQRLAFVKRAMAEALTWGVAELTDPWKNPKTSPADLRRVAELLRLPGYHRDHADLEKTERLIADGKNGEAWELLREILQRHPWKPERVPEERPRE